MKINEFTHLLEPVPYLASPHCDDRPVDTNIDMLVIHGISLPPGEFGTEAIQEFFCGQLNFSTHPYFETIKHLKVSTHLLIKRTGKIIQFVPFSKRTWHAGKSHFQGKENCNDFSIGIELEGTDDLPYEVIQYQQLANIIKLLQKSYPKLSRSRIVGHCDIAPGRKTDPGVHFNWTYLHNLLNFC